MLKINQISVFFIILGPILSVGGSKPEIFIDGIPAPECEKAPAESPLRVTSIEREARPGEKEGSVIVNFYSRKRNETCPATESSECKTCPIPKLNGPCTSAEFCQSIKFSNCSDGLCKCLPGYVEGNGLCFGKLGSGCSVDFECGPRDSVCSSGTCQCPAVTRYPKDGKCHEFSSRLGFPVHSLEACRYLKNSIYSSGSCQCAPGDVQRYGQCLGKLGTNCSDDSECNPPSVCSGGTCQCPATHYSKNGKCQPKLHSPCNSNDQCKVPYSECAKKECKCKKEYAEHDHVCYGLHWAKCNKPTDCALLTFDCKSGICLEVTDYTFGHLYSPKPGTTAIYGIHLYPQGPQFFDFRLGEPGYNPGPKKAGNLHWVRNFTLDRVALIWSWAPNSYLSFVDVWCRAKTSTGKFTHGRIRIPGNGLCEGKNNGTKFSTKDWDVLVDLGPVN